jgi:hypothetical protein
MQQNTLFDDEPAALGRSAVPVLGVAGSNATLTKAQKRFNQLIERLKSQREELARWQAFRQYYQQQLADEYQPLATRLREKRIAMVELLDQAMDGKALGKRERDKARYILGQLLAGLLAQAQDAKLVRLHDKYADVAFGAAQQDRLAILRNLASETFGIDVDAYEGGESPADLEDWLDEQIRASRPDPRQARPRKKSAKAIEREARRDQAAEGGTRAVREAYRKLVSELHPDRETDPAEQVRKTELMQRVNQAYKAGDLLGLLELQLNIEQIDSAALAGLAEERLRHYIHVLDDQSRQLRDELTELIAPFTLSLGDSMSRKVTPDAVQRALDGDISELKGILRKVEMDLLYFQDIRQLKLSLGQQQIHPLDGEEWDMPQDFRPSRRRGRRR